MKQDNSLIDLIEKRKVEKANLYAFMNEMDRMKNEQGLSDSTYNEVQAKVSSKLAFIERSIRDHEALLPEEDKVVCTSCEEYFDFETMDEDDDNNYFCKPCYKELAPAMKAEYDELVRRGEIEPNF